MAPGAAEGDAEFVVGPGTSEINVLAAAPPSLLQILFFQNNSDHLSNLFWTFRGDASFARWW